MKSKGFTLIELLAVIVILAIIALIATPMILGVVERARKGAAESSALRYIDAIEKQIVINLLNSDSADDIIDNVYNIPMNSTYGVKVKGQVPSEGWVQITKGQVVNYSFKIGNYYVNPSEGNTGKANADKSGSLVPQPSGSASTESTVPTIDTCPGCEFVYVTSSLERGTDTVPSEATNDYTTLTSTHPYFLGLIKNASTNVIDRIFVCGVENGTPFCLEGYYNSTYENNEDILNSIFPNCNASASENSPAYCEGSSVNGIAGLYGFVSTTDSFGGCNIDTAGYGVCS